MAAFGTVSRFAPVVVCITAVSSFTIVASAGTSAARTPSSSSMARIQAAPRIPNGATAVGALPSSAPVTGAVVLKPRDNAALTSFISAVTDKSSPLYHHYLAPGTFGARFGPTAATIATVKSALQAHGLRVTSVASDGLLMKFIGSAGRVENAFHTGLTRYRLADGTMGQATTSSVELSSSLAGAVSSVVGLNDLVRRHPANIVRAPATARPPYPPARSNQFPHPTGSPTPCAAAKAAAHTMGGLTDDQIANAYGAFGLYRSGDFGAGQRIAVYELEPFAVSDIQAFDTCYFGATAAAQMIGRLHTVPVDGGQPTGQGSGEAILDVQDVSAIAPGANIDVYSAPNTTFGGIDEYAAIINNGSDKVVTSSWGLCEQAVQLGEPGIQNAENFLFEQAAAQGQSVFSAAGDVGSDDCNAFRAPAPVPGQNPLSVDDPSGQPYVVAVGGTTIDNATQPPAEHVWNDGANWGAGGGGISQSWAMPTWQRDSAVPGIVGPTSAAYTQANSVETAFGYPTGFCQSSLPGANANTPCRLLPDVSAQADEFTGAVTIYSTEFPGWITIGGTSSSAPIWAALLALVNASATCASNPATASGVGFVSPLLYAVASNPVAYAASFNDITTGNNDVFGIDNGQVFPATTGFDLATGLGSPRLTGAHGGAGLAAYLCATAGPSPRQPAVSGLAPGFLPTSGGTVTITGQGFESHKTPDVAGIEVGGWQIPPGQFTVTSPTSITATFPVAADTTPPGSPAPQDGAGPAAVIVTLTNGRSSAPGPAAMMQYVDESAASSVPTVTGVSPYGGSQSGAAPVTIFGSGFTGATKVTFGGVSASGFSVKSPFEISVTPPAYGAQSCAPSVSGQTPTTDICQVQVEVTNPHGTSATGTILPPLEGAVPFPTPMGVVPPPAGCGCEVMPAPSEYDYVPTPTVTSVSTSAGPAAYAGEFGGTLITVTGTGFDPFTFDWASFGDPSLSSSVSFCGAPFCAFLTGTEMQIVAPAIVAFGGTPSVQPATLPVSVKTLAGQSNQLNVTYAGVPTVTGVLSTTGKTGGPDTGGTPITLTGSGFAQVLGPIGFVDVATPFSLGTQYTYTVSSDTKISTQTVSQNPAAVDVEVCSVTGCSHNPPADEFLLFPPGDPKVTSISPASGPAAGGTKVTINGQNLGCVTGVFFGTVAAATFSNTQALLDCGSTSQVQVTAPPGTAGTKVLVTVTTVESDITGSGPSASSAMFTYKKK